MTEPGQAVQSAGVILQTALSGDRTATITECQRLFIAATVHGGGRFAHGGKKSLEIIGNYI